MRKKPATTGRPKPQSRRLSEVGNVPPSGAEAQDPAGAAASKTLAASGPKSLMKTRSGQGGTAPLGVAVSFESDASDAPPQAGAIQYLEQPATEN